jgi:hypothetical protein
LGADYREVVAHARGESACSSWGVGVCVCVLGVVIMVMVGAVVIGRSSGCAAATPHVPGRRCGERWGGVAFMVVGGSSIRRQLLGPVPGS